MKPAKGLSIHRKASTKQTLPTSRTVVTSKTKHARLRRISGGSWRSLWTISGAIGSSAASGGNGTSGHGPYVDLTARGSSVEGVARKGKPVAPPPKNPARGKP